MLRWRLMVSVASRIAPASFGCAVFLVLSACFTEVALAGTMQKDRRPNYGRIEITTTPGGYPILIDNQPNGETSSTKRLIDLPPGRHTVEILFPNETRWVRIFDVEAGKIVCIGLNYRPRTIDIPIAAPVKLPCPYPVNVSAPSSVSDGDTITFAADVAYKGPSALTYTWTVSPPSARIISGVGTPTITVDSTGLGKQRVTAILVVDDGSGDPNCRQRAKASTNVLAPAPPVVQPRKFDEFPSISFNDDKARLDNLAIELQNAPGAQGYIIVYGGRRSSLGQADRLAARARNYLVSTRGIDSSRIVVINGGYRENDTYELWVVPQGAQPPQATPTVSPAEVSPGRGPRPSRRRR